MGRALQIAHMGNDDLARKLIITGIWSIGNCGGISAAGHYGCITYTGRLDGTYVPATSRDGNPLTTSKRNRRGDKGGAYE